jgi:Na+/H+ antiporter NhaD/arsenite permease-like protein
LPTVVASVILLAMFFALDTYLYSRGERKRSDPSPDRNISIKGGINFVLLGVIIVAILMSAYWRPGIVWYVGGVDLQLQNVVRDLIFVAAAIASILLTPKACRTGNQFEWGPIVEVAKIFAAIFVCLVPMIAILKAGANGAMAPLVALVSSNGAPNNLAYFWLTGALSSFLDNAPTYLVFFEIAGGDPAKLMTTLAGTLAAISAGAVFMGANSYIGNAPNFMVYAIARRGGVRMPSFFGYMLWSGAILLPLFLLMGSLFFSRN